MKKNLVSPILFALLSTHAYAAAPQQNGTTTDTTSSITASPPTTQPTNTAATTAAPTAAPTIDCNYHITANQAVIDSALITSWAEKATLQSFSFTPEKIQSQLEMLKPCYTEQGWKGFNEALQKSGNIESIKTQQLNVSSQADGAATINSVKDNQWKVTLLIQVVYQNDKEKVTQHLMINVLVGRKANGDLGVMQLVAATKPDSGTTSPKTTETQTPAPTETTTKDMKSMTSPGASDTPPPPLPEDKTKPVETNASQPTEPTPPNPAAPQ